MPNLVEKISNKTRGFGGLGKGRASNKYKPWYLYCIFWSGILLILYLIMDYLHVFSLDKALFPTEGK